MNAQAMYRLAPTGDKVGGAQAGRHPLFQALLAGLAAAKGARRARLGLSSKRTWLLFAPHRPATGRSESAGSGTAADAPLRAGSACLSVPTICDGMHFTSLPIAALPSTVEVPIGRMAVLPCTTQGQQQQHPLLSMLPRLHARPAKITKPTSW